VAGNILESRLLRKVNWEETFRLYPNLSDTGPLRSILDTTLTVNIARQMFFYISAVDRYESSPQPGVKNNNFLLLSGIRWVILREGK